MGNTDQVKSQAEKASVEAVYRELQQQVTTQPATSVVQCLSHDAQLSVPAKSNQSIAQVFSLNQHERREDDDNSDCSQWTCERPEESARILDEIRWRCGYLDRNRMVRTHGVIRAAGRRSRRWRGFSGRQCQFFIQLPNRSSCLAEGAVSSGV